MSYPRTCEGEMRFYKQYHFRLQNETHRLFSAVKVHVLNGVLRAWYTRKKAAILKVYVQLPNETFHL